MSSHRHVVAGVDVTDAVNQLVDQAPPLTADRRDKIRALLRPVAIKAATPAPRRSAA